MRPTTDEEVGGRLKQPELLGEATELDRQLKLLTSTELAAMMGISSTLAGKTHALMQNWTTSSDCQRPAVDSFLGDIFSGLQVADWSRADHLYANEHLRILSGLYGILRPLDGICPYRLEMGYKLPGLNLYDFWGDKIAGTLPIVGSLLNQEPIINIAAVEYSRVITPYVNSDIIITPNFLTINTKTKMPTFVAVHAKIARGAYANWLIKNRLQLASDVPKFTDLGYRYNSKLSTPQTPVFVCRNFGGLGLSIRLK